MPRASSSAAAGTGDVADHRQAQGQSAEAPAQVVAGDVVAGDRGALAEPALGRARSALGQRGAPVGHRHQDHRERVGRGDDRLVDRRAHGLGLLDPAAGAQRRERGEDVDGRRAEPDLLAEAQVQLVALGGDLDRPVGGAQERERAGLDERHLDAGSGVVAPAQRRDALERLERPPGEDRQAGQHPLEIGDPRAVGEVRRA